MAGEQTVSGHITWKQQAGSVLQQRKIFRSSLTTRRSHFIWPGRCGQWMDTFPTVRVGYAVIHLSIAPSPSHFFFHFSSSEKPNTLLNLFILSSSRLPLSLISFFPTLATLPHRVFVSPIPSPSNFLIPPLSHPLSLSVCGQSHLI